MRSYRSPTKREKVKWFFDTDEHPLAKPALEKLAKLRPAFSLKMVQLQPEMHPESTMEPALRSLPVKMPLKKYNLKTNCRSDRIWTRRRRSSCYGPWSYPLLS